MHRKRGSEEALGYGWGAHRCIAEGLSRTELEVVFGKLRPNHQSLLRRRVAEELLTTVFRSTL